jgi:hypothetical protein
MLGTANHISISSNIIKNDKAAIDVDFSVVVPDSAKYGTT